MLTFDRAEFDKAINLSVKKKVRYEDIWKTNTLEPLFKIADIKKGSSITEEDTIEGNIPVVAGGQEPAYFHNVANRKGNIITVSASGAYAGFINYFTTPIFASDRNTISSKDESKITTKLIYLFLKLIQNIVFSLQEGQAQPHVYADDLEKIKIPLPTPKVQQKIITEIEILEAIESKAKKELDNYKETIIKLFNEALSKATTSVRLSDDNIFDISIGKRVLKPDFVENGKIPVYSANVIEPFGNIDTLLIKDFSKASVIWGIDGDWMVNYIPENYPFYPTDHCGVLRVKNSDINEKYLAFVLQKEGEIIGFSRTKRASIDRIQGIKIPVPPISLQQKIVSQIQTIEQKITQLQNTIASIPQQKEAILKKYL